MKKLVNFVHSKERSYFVFLNRVDSFKQASKHSFETGFEAASLLLCVTTMPPPQLALKSVSNWWMQLRLSTF